MAMQMRTSFNLPFTHYALIYMDNMGKLKVSESASIRDQHDTLFTPDVREKFLEILGPKIGYHKPLIRSMWSNTGLPGECILTVFYRTLWCRCLSLRLWTP